jgi:hypothetical protein
MPELRHCTECNKDVEILNTVETGEDISTGNPFRIVQLKCGHRMKFLTVTNQFDISGLFRSPQEFKINAGMVQGKPQVFISGESVQYAAAQINMQVGQNSTLQNVNIFNNVYGITNEPINNEILKAVIDKINESSNDIVTKQNISLMLESLSSLFSSKPDPKSIAALNKLKGSLNTQSLERVFSHLSPFLLSALKMAFEKHS